LDDYFRTYAGLRGAPYDWTWNKPKGALTYEWCKKHGSDCSRSIDVTCTRLGLPDPGDTVEIANTLISRQPYPRDYNANIWFLRGTVLVNGNAGGVAGDHSHVAIVSDSKNQTVAHCREYPEPSGIHLDDDLKQVDLIARFEWVGYLPALGVDYDPLAGFCGHFSPPSLLAIWMATIARFRYQIPEVLPVMCSMQELKDAWVPKALPYYAVRGYSNTDNHGRPLGFFQQRPSRAWGTAEEILDPNHALGAFCQEAATLGREVDETDPPQLGEWIADVQQRSREDLRGEYAKHYDTAIHLIASGHALLPEEYRYGDGDSRF
jgi:hypothetical protein